MSLNPNTIKKKIGPSNVLKMSIYIHIYINSGAISKWLTVTFDFGHYELFMDRTSSSCGFCIHIPFDPSYGSLTGESIVSHRVFAASQFYFNPQVSMRVLMSKMTRTSTMITVRSTSLVKKFFCLALYRPVIMVIASAGRNIALSCLPKNSVLTLYDDLFSVIFYYLDFRFFYIWFAS